MEFAPIGPLWSLEKYIAPAKYQMCLAPYCQNAEYLAFYKRMVAEGKNVILDNGAYESKRMGFGQYEALINDLKPTEYIVADSIGDDKQTRVQWDEWFRRFEDRQILSKPGFVMHDKFCCTVPKPAQFVCLPKHWGKERANIAKLWTRFENFPVHALGFIDDDPLAELPKLAALGVRSIDSSEPVWKGIFDLPTGQESRMSPLCKFKEGVLEKFYLDTDRISKNLTEVQRLCRPSGLRLPIEYKWATPEKAKRDITALRYDLIPKEFLDDLARTFEEGLRYGEDNWKRGDDDFFRDVMNHAQGHIANYNIGDRSKPHLAHAAWNLLARAWYDRRKDADKLSVQDSPRDL